MQKLRFITAGFPELNKTKKGSLRWSISRQPHTLMGQKRRRGTPRLPKNLFITFNSYKYSPRRPQVRGIFVGGGSLMILSALPSVIQILLQ